MADSPLPLFIDTNLGTYFAMAVPPDSTVADLKEKIRTNHPLCFPDFGEVSVQAMKVRRKGSFYHLLDSMPVKCSFAGVKGAWFLHLDLVSTTSIKKVQTDAAKSMLNDCCPKKLYITQTECTTIPSSQNNEVENRGFVMNDMLADTGRISLESPTVHEGQTVPDTLLVNLASQGDSSLPNTAISQSLKLQSSDQLVSGVKNGGAEVHLNVQGDDLNDRLAVPLSELKRRSNPAPMELEEPVNERNAVVGFHFQQGKELIIDQVKKGEGKEGHPVVGVKDAGASPIAIKKVKSRKKGSTVQNDQVLEGQFQYPAAEQKKRKRDGSLEAAGKDQVTGHNFDTGARSKMTSYSETILPKAIPQEEHENNPASSDALPSKSSHDDSLQLNPVEDGPKKKKKKRVSRLYDEFPQSRLTDPSVEKKDSDVRNQNQAAEGNNEDLVKKHLDLAKQNEGADIISKGSEKVIDGSNVEVSTTEPSYTTHRSSDYSKEILSESIITGKHLPSQEVTNVDKEGPLDWNSVGMHRESSGAVIPKQAEHVGNHSELDSVLPADPRSNRKKRRSEKHASSKGGSLLEHVNGNNAEEVPAIKDNNSNREADPATVVEDLVNTNPSNVDSGVSANIDAGSACQDRRKKGDKTEAPNPFANTSETADALVGQASLDDPNETLGEHIRCIGKESEGGSLVTSGFVDSILTSKPNEKKPKLGKKNRGKSKLPEPTLPENDRSLAEDGEDNSKEPLKIVSNGTSGGDHGERESKVVAPSGEVAANVISATVDSPPTSKPNDEKPKHGKKKKGKAELPGPIMPETFHYLAKDNDRDSIKEPLKEISRGTSGSDHGHLEKDPNVAGLSGEANAMSATVDSTVQNSKDKKLKGSRKKSGKAELLEPLMSEAAPSLKDDAKEDLKEPAGDNFNRTSGGNFGQLGKESKGTTIAGEVAADLDSPMVVSTALSHPNDNKSKRKKRSSEKPGLLNQEFTKEENKITEKKQEETLAGDRKGVGQDSKVATISTKATPLEKDPKVADLSGEANVMSATVDSTVQNSKDKKLKSSRKKSGKAELLEPLMSEAAPSLKDDAKEDLKEPAGDNFNGTSGGNFGQPGKESRGTTIAGEVAADLDSSMVVSTTLSHPNDNKSKRKKKSSEKTGLLNQEFTKEENKITEEKRKETLAGDRKGVGQDSKLATISTKATPLEHTTELNPVVTLNAKRKSSRQDKKKTKKLVNNELNISSEDRHTHANLEKEVGATIVRAASAFNAGINSDVTKHLDYIEHSNINTAELVNGISNEHKTAQLSAEKVGEKNTTHLSGKTLEESGKETDLNMNLQKSAEMIEASDPTGLTKSDGDKIKFLDYFAPQASQTVPVNTQILPARISETKKHKEVASRKRKPFLPPLDHPNNDLLSPSVSDEQHKTSNTDLVDPLGRLANEQHKINETPKKKTVKKTRQSDIHSRNTSPVLVSPSKLLGDRAAKKQQESSSHPQVSASVDGKMIHKKSKISSEGTESKLQPPAGNESIDTIVATDEGSLSKNSDVLIRSGHVGESITQKHSSTDAEAHPLSKESSDNYSASSDSTGEASRLPGKYRVAVRKIPSKRYRNEVNMPSQKEISLGTSATIFDGTSESSKDEFVINHRQTSLKAGLDNSSNSADSDGDLEETQTSSYKDQAFINSPDGGSVAYDETNKEGGGERSTMPRHDRSSSTRQKARPLNMIFKRTNIFQNAMRNASQSEVDDSETQPVDCVLESQPE